MSAPGGISSQGSGGSTGGAGGSAVTGGTPGATGGKATGGAGAMPSSTGVQGGGAWAAAICCKGDCCGFSDGPTLCRGSKAAIFYGPIVITDAHYA